MLQIILILLPLLDSIHLFFFNIFIPPECDVNYLEKNNPNEIHAMPAISLSVYLVYACTYIWINKTNINVPNTSPHTSANIHSIFVLFIDGDVITPNIKYATHAPPTAPNNYAVQYILNVQELIVSSQ